ncbi:MAG TPA: MopE-related protein [Polyangiaceae bacterium]|nr:MopE-related protein [Polyangiaceae bacterium]
MRALILQALLPLATLSLISGSMVGCTTEGVCFDDCTGIVGGGTGGNGSSNGGNGGTLYIGMGGEDDGPSLGGKVSGGGTGALEDAGMPCDDVDLLTDINNCGTCGTPCVFSGGDASCVNGECVLGECSEFRYDLDGDDSNGCEYTCPVEESAEVCDNLDNDCDGVKDNGFDLTTDDENCGVCGNVCKLLHATSSGCEPGSGMPACVVLECEPGWSNTDGVDANGCEYECVPRGAGGVVCDGTDPNCGQELCDEWDNDCNGVINDGNDAQGGPEGGLACYEFCGGVPCVGQCTNGVTTCVGTDLVCLPGDGPSLETCDGEDNDCDGVEDNGFNLSTDPNNCGACGVSCVDALPNAVAQCTDANGAAAPPPACSILACKPGFKDYDSNQPGCEPCPKFPTSAETCNGVDDDCDGVVDNAAAIAAQKPSSVAVFCNNGRNIAGTPCAGTTVVCGGTDGWVCDYPNSPVIEIDSMTGKVPVVEQLCDDQDGNCDGQQDEAFLNKGDTCSVGTGICARTAAYDCSSDNLGTECTVSEVPTDAKDEECNGLDDNCDGQIDERVPTGNPTCYNGGTHACLGYSEPMVLAGGVYIYTYEASRPDATDTDPGINDVRSCSKANVLPWTSVKQTEADAACKAVPTSNANTKMRLCSESEWQMACLAGGAGTSPTWAFSSAPTTYDDDVCNDANAGVDAPWATSFDNGQAKRCRTSTQIWDMTGNVAEWTDSCYTILNKQYCRVRGGSFLSLGPATACNFSFVLDIPSFANFDLGFRCCSSVAP